MNAKAIAWVTEDTLRRTHPLFEDNAEPVFVFDDQRLTEQPYSIKRLVFIMQTLEEMETPAWRGDTVAVLRAVAADHNTRRIRIPESPDPHVTEVAKTLGADFDVEIVTDTPFTPPVEGEFSRFFRFWNKVKTALLR